MEISTATFGAGCFWCVEAVFQRVPGVVKVTSGYMGGSVKNPAYKEVCTGRTGHAEVVQLEYNADKVSYRSLLDIFWKVHDPTTLNRQGNDVGTQYRSAIFFHTEEQKEEALSLKEELDANAVFGRPIVTEIVPATTFYAAEKEHLDYYRRNSDQPYCQFVIRPKLEKLEKILR